MRKLTALVLLCLVIASLTTMAGMAQEKLAKGEVKAISEEAYIYAFPMVMGYGIMNEYAIDKSSDQ